MAPQQIARPTSTMQPPSRSKPVPSHHHPRRPPAHRSVSLLHKERPATSSPQLDRSDSSSDSQVLNQPRGADDKSNDSPSSLLPLARDSSGESSNADKWFEKSNNDVRDNSASFADNDPPFYMRNSSSSDTPPDGVRLSRQFAAPNDGALSLPLRTGLLQLGTDGSSTEDFRSVIDDLTVENKKLKRRLKKYEKLHDSHLRDEKLFEVRIHGLPPEKKRELEETLRKFTASLGTSGFHPNGYEGLLPVLNKATSSSTSLHHTDSAYASMSASGQGSSAQSGNDTMYRSRHPSAATRHQNIHSYLHHIPEALLLHPNPSTMSERSKKKLVVRRLEQIFAGKGAVAGPHQHPMQQQEISQIAARESRLAFEAQGERARQEGSREAPIMRQETEDPADPSGSKPDGNNTSPDDPSTTNKPHEHSSATAIDQHGNFEQRPTRPLDVDPHRAQIPADNIRYFRHLGFSPLDADTATPIEEGHGWIYLNLLINMAQLHTINVTADFVRKALSEYHSELELSHDGRKVRWKGGAPAAATSSSGGGSSNDYAGMDTPDGQSPRKRPRLMHRESSRRHNVQQGSASAKGQENNKLIYTPLFFHKSSSESDSSSSEDEEGDSMTSPFPVAPAGDSSGMTSSGMRTTSTKKTKRRDDGPIIFYNNARFCTDLSGDRKPMATNAPQYTKINSALVGKPQNLGSGEIIEKRGPLAKAFELPEPMDLSDNPIPASMELAFPPRLEAGASAKTPPKPIELEVSGIGGVWPSDHFHLTVESRHARREKSVEAYEAQVPRPLSKLLPPRFQQILRGGTNADVQGPTATHDQEIIALHKKDLPPSTLPPALGFMSLDESNGDDDSDMEDEASASPGSPVPFPPSAAPQPVDLHYASSDEEEENDDGEDDEESSGSLDLLAAAREADPDAIREKEREYDANMAERLAEEIPAGSSAATAGGGSGFASPASNMNREEYKRLVKEARGRHETLKRAQTSDSMKVQGTEESSDEEDEEMSDIAS